MKTANIIVLSGQSNAVGVGHVKCLPKHFNEEKIKEYENGYENIKINYYSHDKVSGGFVKTTLGCTEIHKDTLGPEIGIAEYLDENYKDEEFFIVKAAVGGANIKRDYLSPSNKGDYDTSSFDDNYGDLVKTFFSGKNIKAGWCYNYLVKAIRDSIEYLEAKGYNPEIKAFCWMQGESDAFETEDVKNYICRYENLLKDLNEEFKDYFKNCIYLDGGISDKWKYYKEMNEIKKNYAATHKNSYYIDTIGEGLITDNEPFEAPDIAHSDSDCTIKLGRLFAEKIKF